jgi:hypothetical protein
VGCSLGMRQGLLGLRMGNPRRAIPGLASVAVSASRVLVVPVHAGPGMASLRCGRLPGGERVGIAFTSQAGLAKVMGADQPWIRLSAAAMRDMLAPLGVTRIQVDPGVIAAARPVSVSA